MNFVWNMEGMRVGSISMNRWEGAQMWTSGWGQTPRGALFQWEITALKGGWYVVISLPSGRAGEYQGATFNAPLEIATAANRLL